ncbi:MAG: SUMF1/EgtB/PvdO family nonheme iron enzyme [Candidatus Saganbacteria bacterium]|nr:SUMF1/EgtB/PvdO family nonheme iron enzyme [Candidatus Saganbacteria bacterium]
MRITGNVTGKMIAVAILKTQAATQGQLEQKQAAGLGRFLRYLGRNQARQDSWDRASHNIPPEITMARASLNQEWLERAGRLIAHTTSREMRCTLLGQIISPQLQKAVFLYETLVRVGMQIGEEVSAGALVPALQPTFPGTPLEMVEIKGGIVKITDPGKKGDEALVQERAVDTFGLSREEITNEQYAIYIGQTAVSAPKGWEDRRVWITKPYDSVGGVNVLDKRSFARWLGMRLPTRDESEWVRQQTVLPERLILGGGTDKLGFRVAMAKE